VLCDTRDTSILIVDTYVTIPVSPKSRYTAVYRSSKKYSETAQVSRVSTIPRVLYHCATSNLQAYDAETNVIVTHSRQQSLSHQVVLHCPLVVLLSRNDWLLVDKEPGLKFEVSDDQISYFKDFCRLEM